MCYLYIFLCFIIVYCGLTKIFAMYSSLCVCKYYSLYKKNYNYEENINNYSL